MTQTFWFWRCPGGTCLLEPGSLAGHRRSLLWAGSRPANLSSRCGEIINRKFLYLGGANPGRKLFPCGSTPNLCDWTFSLRPQISCKLNSLDTCVTSFTGSVVVKENQDCWLPFWVIIPALCCGYGYGFWLCVWLLSQVLQAPCFLR